MFQPSDTDAIFNDLILLNTQMMRTQQMFLLETVIKSKGLIHEREVKIDVYL